MLLSNEFKQHRGFLTQLAYRMMGERAAAEDIVQEAFVRCVQRTTGPELEVPRAYLTRVVTNLCVDELKSARVRRESYVGHWLPEPLVGEALGGDPIEKSESLSMAMMLVLERLSPLERAAYILREVFEFSPEEIGDFLSREPAAIRQLVHRAKAHLEEHSPRFEVSEQTHAELLQRFASACMSGDLETLVSLLQRDAVLLSDGGGRVRAALNAIQSADLVARFVIGVSRKGNPQWTHTMEKVNGQLGIVSRQGETIVSVLSLQIIGEHIAAVHIVLNPDKLR